MSVSASICAGRRRTDQIPGIPSRRRRLVTWAALPILLLGPGGLASAAPDPYLIEIKKLTASDGAAQDLFGFSVAISGDTAIVGGLSDDKIGRAYVLGRNQGGANNWSEVKKLTASDGTVDGWFGFSVAISGDTIVVSSIGRAYIFERNAGGANNWGEVKKLVPSESSGVFGVSVSISGSTVVVGAPGQKDTDTSAVFVFDRDQGGINTWGQVKKLTASDTTKSDFFGNAVAISGDTIVAGAPGADVGANSDQGEAYIFERNQGGANNWGEARKLVSNDGAKNDQFGCSVAIDGDTMVAGAKLHDIGSNADQGAAYNFNRNQGGAGNWGQARKITESNGKSGDHFGYAVAIGGDRAVISIQTGGGLFYSSSESRRAVIFDRNLGGTDNWGELQKLNPLSGEVGDLFGSSLAISGGTILAGAPYATIGANKFQGSSYIFNSVPGPNPQIRAQTFTIEQGHTTGGGIATVSDDATPPGNLTVIVISSPPGITLSSLTNTEGRVTASVSVSCSVPVGSYAIGLQVSDAGGLSASDNLLVNVTANTPPSLGTYPASRVSLGGSINVIPSAGPSETLGSLSASAPGFSGILTANKGSGMIVISNAGPAGNYTVTITATDDCGASSSKTFALTVLGQMATITVNTTADTTANDGSCSLREAIVAANTNAASGALAGECVAGLPGTDRIAFNIPGAGPHTISPASALPGITESIEIDGLTQPGANGATWPPTLKIVLSGNNAGSNATGLAIGAAANGTFSAANFSTVRGLVINQFALQGLILSSGNGVVQTNFIGTDVTGTSKLGNGVGINAGGSSNLIGGTTAGARNLVSGNGTGIGLPGSANRLEGNFIGTDAGGTLDLGNSGSGVSVGEGFASTVNAAGEVRPEAPGDGGDVRPALAPPSSVIGGSIPGAGNIISGNDQDGVLVRTFGGASVTIEGNFIGTDVTGTARLGNSGNGVWLMFTAFGGTVVGGNAASRNVISANAGAGVKLGGDNTSAIGNALFGNYIGTDATGTANLGNGQDGVLLSSNALVTEVGRLIGTYTFGLIGTATNVIAFNARDGVRVEGNAKQNNISYNSIFNNGGLGINLGTDGVTPNDAGDSDTGPNNLQNFPVLTSVSTDGATTTVQGTFNARPNLQYTLQFFSNAAADPSGNGEGQTWVGDQVVHTDGSGNATFLASLPTAVSPGRLITATAAFTTLGNSDPDQFGTSEFSSPQVVEGLGASPPSQLLNISTRLRVQTGENVLIGGFIITGTDPKKVIIRGIGPSLAQFFNGALADPTLELYQGNTLIDGNDNWIDRRAEIEATGIPPTNDLEAAIVRTLAPGAYTAIVRGKNNSTGIGLVEAYDLDQAANSKLANISTRGFVDSGDNVMIGGFIIGNSGGGGATVVVRAIGPALGNFGIAGALQDPTLDLVNAQGVVLRSNNNWKETQQTEIESVDLQPGDDRECALAQTLAPGNYTAIVRGKDNTTGVGLVEVYNVE